MCWLVLSETLLQTSGNTGSDKGFTVAGGGSQWPERVHSWWHRIESDWVWNVLSVQGGVVLLLMLAHVGTIPCKSFDCTEEFLTDILQNCGLFGCNSVLVMSNWISQWLFKHMLWWLLTVPPLPFLNPLPSWVWLIFNLEKRSENLPKTTLQIQFVLTLCLWCSLDQCFPTLVLKNPWPQQKNMYCWGYFRTGVCEHCPTLF